MYTHVHVYVASKNVHDHCNSSWLRQQVFKGTFKPGKEEASTTRISVLENM